MPPTTTRGPRRSRLERPQNPRPRRKVLNRILENPLIRRVSFEEYRHRVRDVYDGPQGALLAACCMLTPHSTVGERLFRRREFDLRGARTILDVGSGAGQIAKHVLKHADPQTEVVCADLSYEMLRRARNRLRIGSPQYVSADLTRLPFADESFDRVTCGYVLEHLPDAGAGLKELSRVMKPGARMLLLTTEQNIYGAISSRVWRCRTYSRRELPQTCEASGLRWHKELWFTRMHKLLRAGGICVELVKE